MSITVTDFLRDRGVPEEALALMEEQKIDVDVIRIMDDSALANYIPSYGDRIALFNFCRNQQPMTKHKLGLLERLREKMKIRKENKESGEEPQTAEPHSRWKLTTRTIEIGWIHKEKDASRQVRAKQGGGTRKVVMDVNAGFNEIMKEGKSLFSPKGVSSKGHESGFTFDVWDFKQNPFSDNVSIGTVYDTVKLPKLRFYIATQPKPESGDNAELKDSDFSFEDRDEIIEISDTPSASLSPNYTDQDQDQASIDLTDRSAADLPVIRDHPPFSEISLILEGDNIIDNSDPEITFGPHTEAEFNQDDTLIYQPETFHHPASPKVIMIHHANNFSDMIEGFSDPEILSRPLEIRRLLPDNSEEAGSGSGLLRDTYSAFWQDFYDRCTLGATLNVPFIRHDFKADTWKAIGRVFLKGYQDCHYLPIKLAPPFIEEMLFRAVYSDLTEVFLQFISCQEREVLMQALQDFSSVEPDDLLEVLNNYECRRRVSADTLPAIVEEISHKELVQKPNFVIDCWKDITKPQMRLSYEDLTKMYADLRPTTKKVSRLLKFSADMTAKQKEVEHHLKRYVRELDEGKLGKFLRFCTGSDLIVSDTIMIEFTEMSEFTRRPIGRTCGMFLELPECYENFLDFRAEFNEILDSNVWVMDIV